jgi:hypothetical protein
MSDFRTTAQWFEAYQEGNIGFVEWMTTGHDEARKRLDGLGKSIEDVGQFDGVSLLGTVTAYAEKGEKDAESWGESFRRRIEEINAEVEESRSSFDDTIQTSATGGGGGLTPEQQAELDALIEQTEKRLEIIQESFLTEDEIAREKLQADIEALKEGFELKLITEEDYLLQQAMLEEKYMHEAADRAQELSDKELAIEKQKQAARLNLASSAFRNLSSLMNTENKKLFEIGKVAAMAQATIDGYAAIQSSYKFGSSIGGPIVGAAFAATAGVATAVQIAGIASTQFGSKGGVTAGAPGGSTPSGVTPTQTAQPEQQGPAGGTLTVQGLNAASLFSGDAVAQIAEELLDYQRRGGSVLLQG